MSLNDNQIRTYLSALEAEFLRANADCTSDCTTKSVEATKLFSSLKQTFPKVKDIVNEKNVAPNLAAYLKGDRGFAQLKKQSGGNMKDKEIYLFKAEWCPHCVGFKPTWKKLEENLGNKYTFITFDSDKDKASIKKWDIKGYPTIIKKTGNNMKEYVGPRDEESVKKFITSD
jgi:thiol-disulfide isomerase/thioredoxin